MTTTCDCVGFMAHTSSRCSNVEIAAGRLLDWLYIFGLPDTKDGQETLASHLNALATALGRTPGTVITRVH